jgi:hypothetical protein
MGAPTKIETFPLGGDLGDLIISLRTSWLERIGWSSPKAIFLFPLSFYLFPVTSEFYLACLRHGHFSLKKEAAVIIIKSSHLHQNEYF